jgi:hypothetical protein
MEGVMTPVDDEDLDLPAEISPEKVCYIVVKAQELEAKLGGVELDAGDDEARLEVENFADDPTAIELREAINALGDDEQVDVIALLWVGRGDFDASEFEEAREAAMGEYRRATTADYLLGTPLLGELLEEALSAYGRSCEEFGMGHV